MSRHKKEASSPKKTQPKRKIMAVEPMQIKTLSRQLDLRGLLVEEALERLDKHIDDALLAGNQEILIIHGKGTGVLRAAVQQHLRRLSFVKSQRPGMYGEGEMGVTVVELK